jgi:hypothetical protein
MQTFIDEDAEYVAWRDDHPSGLVVNHNRVPGPSYLKLHRTTCRALRGEPLGGRGTNWTSKYGKTCSDSPLELGEWALAIRAELVPCRVCHPMT